MPKKFKDLTGKKNGRLTVIESFRNDKKQLFWKCQCECGLETNVIHGNIFNGATKSCGCLRAEASQKHGGTGTKLYARWLSIKDRILNPKNARFESYGGRGIKMCERWLNSFEAFRDDMGPTYQEGLAIDRIDNDGDYCPENCRWANRFQQQSNMRNSRFLEFNGKRLIISEWARVTGLKRGTIMGRLNRGWPMEMVLAPEI